MTLIEKKIRMENKTWYDSFITSLSDKYPKRTQLVKDLMDLLCIEREAVYRRLRGEVVFSANEIIKIASALNLSLDKITGIASGQILFNMQPINYIEPSEKELGLLRNVIDSITLLQNLPDTEFMDVCNKLPRQLIAGYSYLNRFYLFKWLYQYESKDEIVPFSKVIISEEKAKITTDYCKTIKLVPNSAKETTAFFKARPIFCSSFSIAVLTSSLFNGVIFSSCRYFGNEP
jgi:hypothetical protein